MKDGSSGMEFTGERFVPEIRGNIELEHLHRYLQACEIAEGKIVLDIASGEGYGSAMLSEKAKMVFGVDISADAVGHATGRYVRSNLKYIIGSCVSIPLPDSSVDMVVSFETIEHHDEHDEMMHEIKRVLLPDGVLLLSSPDRLHYSIEQSYRNPYHIKELSQEEFKQLLSRYFRNVVYWGQRVVYGSVSFSEAEPTSISSYFVENGSVKQSSGIMKPIYRIALASDGQLPRLASGIFEQAINDSEIVQSWRGIITERDEQIADMSRVVAERDEQIAGMGRVVAERDEQIAGMGRVVAERDEQIASMGRVVAERENKLAEVEQRLASIYRSESWRAGNTIARLFRLLFPRNSARYNTLRFLVKPIVKGIFGLLYGISTARRTSRRESDSTNVEGDYAIIDELIDLQTRAHKRSGLTLIADSRVTRKNWAVFFQCGAGSLHENWFGPGLRRWDLAINFFNTRYLACFKGDFRFRQLGTGTKCTAFYHLILDYPELVWSYDYWMLMDDDLIVDMKDIERLFEIVSSNKIDLAQPSLTHDSFCAWPVFRSAPGGKFRSVNGVEIMCPIISRNALRLTKHLFAQTVSGWGLDFAMGKIVREQIGTIPSVIDSCSIKHAKPIDTSGGSFYRALQSIGISAQLELAHLQRLYRTDTVFFELKPNSEGG